MRPQEGDLLEPAEGGLLVDGLFHGELPDQGVEVAQAVVERERRQRQREKRQPHALLPPGGGQQQHERNREDERRPHPGAVAGAADEEQHEPGYRRARRDGASVVGDPDHAAQDQQQGRPDQHVAKGRVPVEGPDGEGRHAPHRRTEAREPRARRHLAQQSEQQRDVQQVGEEDGPLKGDRIHAEEVVGAEEDQVADQERVPAKGLQQEDQGTLVPQIGEVYEVVRKEEGPCDRIVDPCAQRQRQKHERMQLGQCGGRAGHAVRQDSRSAPTVSIKRRVVGVMSPVQHLTPRRGKASSLPSHGTDGARHAAAASAERAASPCRRCVRSASRSCWRRCATQPPGVCSRTVADAATATAPSSAAGPPC